MNCHLLKPDGCPEDNLDLLLAAAATRNMRVVEFILNHRYEWVRTISSRMKRNVLHYAFGMGDIKMIEMLISKIRKEDYWLYSAIDAGMTNPVVLSLIMGCPGPLLYLLDQNPVSHVVPINYKDSKGRNLFHMSVIFGHYILAERLVKLFPQLAEDNSTVNGYDMASYYFQENAKLFPSVYRFLRNYAPILQVVFVDENGNLINPKLQSSIAYCALLLHLTTESISFDFFKTMILNGNQTFVKLLHNYDLDFAIGVGPDTVSSFNVPETSGGMIGNILCYSVLLNQTDYVSYILTEFPDVLVFKNDVIDRSAFHYAILGNNLDIIRSFFELCPLKHRWILTAVDKRLMTPFHYAIAQKYFDVATMFLEYGLAERDTIGWTYRHLTAYYMRFSDSNDEIGPMNYSPCHLGAPLELLGGKDSLSVLGKTAIETQLMIIGGQMESVAMKEPDDDDEKEEDSQQRLQNKKKKKNKKKK